MKVRVENAYTDGHESSREVEVDEPASLDGWFDEDGFNLTGDGHYTDVYEATGERLGSFSEVTIIEATNPDFVNQSDEYSD